LQYESLYVAELRALTADVERAYNEFRNYELERPKPRRIRRDDRLTVEAVRTGRSLTLTFLGSAGAVLMFAKALKVLAETRKTFWESEESYFDAQIAKRDYRARRRKEGEPPSIEERLGYATAVLRTRLWRMLRNVRLKRISMRAGIQQLRLNAPSEEDDEQTTR
jgi:hypothetical protein